MNLLACGALAQWRDEEAALPADKLTTTGTGGWRIKGSCLSDRDWLVRWR